MASKYEHLRVPPEKSAIDTIIPVPDELKIREELIGPHTINPYTQHNSSARSYMFTAHLSQAVTLIEGDEPILETGIDSQFSEYTFGPRAEEDMTIMRVVNRYDNMSGNLVGAVTERCYFTLRDELDENNIRRRTLGIIKVPLYHAGLHQNSGFQYVQDEKFLKKLNKGSFLPKGTRLALPPTVRENGSWAYGVNANMLMCTHPDVAEDGVIISESLAKKMRYHIFEMKAIEFGSDYLPLNLYGDEHNYKPFPEIGEKVGPDSIIMALRSFKDFKASRIGAEDDPRDFTPALLSASDLRVFNPLFDKCTYVKGPGAVVDIGHGRTEDSGVIIDIVCYKNPKKPSQMFYGMERLPEKYANSYIKFNEELLKAYHSICKELGDSDYGYGNAVIRKTPELHATIVDAGKIASDYNININIKGNRRLMEISKHLKVAKDTATNNLPNKVGLANRNENLDTYRVEFTIRYTVTLTKGHKISDLNGGKGVIVDVRPDHLMPFNDQGRVDIIMDSNSVISRMNMARLYGQYFQTASKTCRKKMLLKVGIPIEWEEDPTKVDEITAIANGLDDKTIEDLFTYLMGFLGKFDTLQFDAYANASKEEKRTIITECLAYDVKVLSKVSNVKKAYQCVLDIDNSEYRPYRTNITFPVVSEDGKTIDYQVSKEPMLVGPLYTILVSKTADNMLFTSSPNLNIFAFPTSVTSKNRDQFPYRNSPVKNVSETEGRLYTYYCGVEAMAEIKDRANSVPTFKEIYNNILNADQPTNVEHIVDRAKVPYGSDSAIKLIRSIFKSIGMDMVYVKGHD